MATIVKCSNWDCAKNSIFDESLEGGGHCTLDEIDHDCTGECISAEDIGENTAN